MDGELPTPTLLGHIGQLTSNHVSFYLFSLVRIAIHRTVIQKNYFWDDKLTREGILTCSLDVFLVVYHIYLGCEENSSQ